MTDAIEVEVLRTLDNAHVIISAFDHLGPNPKVGFSLAACCAIVEKESGGRMIWGADPWDEAAYPKGIALDSSLNEKPVTELNYHAYKARRNSGLQPQGCGITQLTYPALQVEAEKAGGCWVPFYNCLVGFRYLRDLFVTHGSAQAGFAAYNGTGPAAVEYGDLAVALADSWQARFNKL